MSCFRLLIKHELGGFETIIFIKVLTEEKNPIIKARNKNPLLV